jgi:hypothetical protein
MVLGFPYLLYHNVRVPTLREKGLGRLGRARQAPLWGRWTAGNRHLERDDEVSVEGAAPRGWQPGGPWRESPPTDGGCAATSRCRGPWLSPEADEGGAGVWGGALPVGGRDSAVRR